MRVSSTTKIWDKTTGETLLQKDDSRKMAIKALYAGAKEEALPAKVSIEIGLKTSVEIENGRWVGVSVNSSVSMSCPQDEDEIKLGLNMCEELALEEATNVFSVAQEGMLKP